MRRRNGREKSEGHFVASGDRMKKYRGAEIGVRIETQGGLIMAYTQREKMGKREALRTTVDRGIFSHSSWIYCTFSISTNR